MLSLIDCLGLLMALSLNPFPCKAFADMKGYYNDITHNNLDLIKSLKDDVASMKRKEAANEKLMYEIAQENKRLAEPLSRALKVDGGNSSFFFCRGTLLPCVQGLSRVSL